MGTIRLGDLLVRRGFLTEEQRDKILGYQELTGRPFGELAERFFCVSPEAVEQAWAEQYAMMSTIIDPRQERVDAEALAMISRRQAWQFRVLPMRIDGAELLCCTTTEHLVRALKFVGWQIGPSCQLVLAEPEALGDALVRYYTLPGMTPEMVAGRGLRIA